jgi:L-aspartate oxidase
MSSDLGPAPASPLARMPHHLRRLPVFRCDLLVVGSGAAGLCTALAAAEGGAHVMLLSKGRLHDTNTDWAQGGIAAAVGRDDHPELHAADTLRAGYGLNETGLVASITHAAPDAMEWLARQGMVFDREPDGSWALGQEGGHRAARILHAGGTATGRELQRALSTQARRHPRVDLYEHAFAVDLLRDAEGEVCGLVALLRAEASAPWEPVVFEAAAVVLATGGGGQIFRETTNPQSATADGLAIALRAGAELQDLEFVQFHPTILYLAGAARFLISEVTRGAGGVLRDRAGVPFMTSVHPDAELAPRDVVSRAIFRRMIEIGDTHVFLDLTRVAGAAARFPGLARICEEFGLDLAQRPIPVRPAVHYFVGGVACDADGRSSLPGLWAVGECAGNGFHGANRMGSNSLLEGIVQGRRAGSLIAAALPPRARRWLHPAAAGAASRPPLRGAELNLLDMTYSLKSLMWRQVGIERDATGLADAVERLDAWEGYLARLGPFTTEGIEIVNMVQVAQTIARCARFREESRGAHFRTDHPAAAATWRAHTRVRPSAGGLRLERRPVLDAAAPAVPALTPPAPRA